MTRVRFWRVLVCLLWIAPGARAQEDLVAPDLPAFADVGDEVTEDARGPVSFGETPAGELAADAPGGTVTFFFEPARTAYPSLVQMKAPFFGAADACTATLIHPQAILTAAHCVLNDQGLLWRKISFRMRPTLNDPQGVRQTVALSDNTIALHRDSHVIVQAGGTCYGKPREAGYLCFSLEADLAVVRLNAPVPDGATRVVPLATSSNLPAFSFFAMVGYGYTFINYDTGKLTGDLRLGHFTSATAPIKITTGSLTSRSFSVQGTVYVNGVPLAVALCNGDSGGPFYIASPAQPSRQVLAGVNHAVTAGGSAAACATLGNSSFLVGVIGNRGFIDAALEKLGLG